MEIYNIGGEYITDKLLNILKKDHGNNLYPI